MAKKKAASAAIVSPKLTEGEQDLLSHIQDGHRLETNSLGGDPILRRLKDNEVIRSLSANRTTIKALEQRGLISPGKGRDPLTIVWRLMHTASTHSHTKLSLSHIRMSKMTDGMSVGFTHPGTAPVSGLLVTRSL